MHRQNEVKLSRLHIGLMNTWIFDDYKCPETNLPKCDMQKPDTNNQTLPRGVPPIKGH